eukprot:Gb_11152 [translate_table: standard]
MNSTGKKYGLQLRAPVQPKKPSRPLPPLGFQNNDDDDDVEEEIARQASKKKSHKDVEQQHKQALEQDPSIFDYDGVYDEMKSKIARPLERDRTKRESKYIGKLMEKAKTRQQEHEIIYERQLAKERVKEDHLYADKEKFVTNAYKKKLAEQAKWLEEERLRELREEAQDVSKKGDMSDFYRNLLKKNVAFGAKSNKTVDEVMLSQRHEGEAQPLEVRSEEPADSVTRSMQDEERTQVKEKRSQEESGQSSQSQDRGNKAEPSSPSVHVTPVNSGLQVAKRETSSNIGIKDETVTEQGKDTGHPDRRQSQEALAAAKERYLARKRMREG